MKEKGIPGPKWSRNIQVSVTITAQVDCPECGEVHTVQLRPEPEEQERRIVESEYIMQPCPACQAELIYFFDIDLGMHCRTTVERDKRVPDPPKQELKQLDLF